MRTPGAADRLVSRTVLAAGTAMLAWMARPVFTGEIPFTGDLLHFNYPLRDFYSRALAAGHPFDWMPSLYGGFYVVGEGQLGAYHPYHWLLYRLLPLDTAFGLELVLAYVALFAGTWLFLRRWCATGGAAFGALLFASCGFNLAHGVHPNIVGVIAHVPWLLIATHDIVAPAAPGRRIRGVAAAGLLTGSQLLFGHPQSAWFSGLIESAYAVMLLAMTPRPERRSGLAGVVAGKVLGVTVGAVQLLATAHAVARSNRATDLSFATSYSLPPEQLLQVLHPYAFWGRVLRWNETAAAPDELAVYGGAVAIVLAVWWLASTISNRRVRAATSVDRFGVSVGVFAVLGLWLALGSHGTLYYLQTYLPFVSQFRVPARYVLFTQLALATLAALAVSRLLQRDASEEPWMRRALLAPLAVTAVSALSAAWLASRNGIAPLSSTEALLAVAIGPLLFVLATTCLAFAVRGARWAVPALVILAAGDQALYGLGGIVGWQDFLTRQQALGYLDTDDVPVGSTRLMHGGFPNLYLLAGYRVLDGYVALAPAKVLDYRAPNALRLAQVGYVHTEFQDAARVPGAEPLAKGWFRLPPPVERARLLTQVRTSADPRTEVQTLNVDDVALVTRGLTVDAGTPGEATILRDDPGRIRVNTRADGRQLLVVSESFDEGWTATVDGDAVPVERVNGDFIGCLVPAGVHAVAFEFRPAHLRVGRTVSLAGVAVALALLVRSRRMYTRRGRATTDVRA